MNTSTTVGIEVRADGTQEAARDLAVVEASIRKVGKGLGEAAQYIGSAKLEKPIAGLDELAAKCSHCLFDADAFGHFTYFEWRQETDLV